MGTETKLLKLATEKFGELSEAEVKFFTATAKGEDADYSSGNEKKDKPENADEWGDERVLRADRIEWLCTDRKASQFITHKGVVVGSVRVDGELNLRFAKMDFPIVFVESVFRDNIILQHSKLKYLNLDGTYTKAIIADFLEVEGSVYLRNGFKAEGEVGLLGAEIGGNLECVRSEFIHPKAYALKADGLKVKGNVFLRNGFKAKGAVRLLGAEIGVTLSCINGKFINPKAEALNADGLKVKGSVFLRDGFKSEGEVILSGVEIGGNLECDNSEFIYPKANALKADGLKVKGSVFLRNGFKAEGEVRLLGVEIGGNLECDGSEFIKPKANALNANGSEFINPKANAFNAGGLKVKGSVFLRNGFKAEGRIDFVRAIIDGYFVYTGVKSPEEAELDLRSAKIGVLFDEEKSWPKEGNLYLHGTVYEEICQESPRDFKSRIKWLRLNGGGGFSPQPYEQLASVLQKIGHEKDAKEVLIAKNEDRAELGAELSKTQWWWYKFFGPMVGYGYKPFDVFWKGPMGIRFLGSILFWLISGWIVFGFGAVHGMITPVQGWAYETDAAGGNVLKDDYPAFNFWVYSIDTFVPLVDLQQSKYWLPNAKMGNTYESIIKFKFIDPTWTAIKSGGAIRVYLWVHIALGWILTTLFVVGLTGLVRK